MAIISKPDNSCNSSETTEVNLLEKNKRLLKEMSELNDFSDNLLFEINKLVEIGRALSAERNIDKLLQLILDEAMAFSNADAGTLYIKEGNFLNFKLIKNVSMKIAMGGSSGNPITFPPVELKESNVSAYVAIKERSVNIPNVYESELFDFIGPKKFDQATGYRTQSMLVMPMKNHEDDIIGVIQLINAQEKNTNKVISFSTDYENLIFSLASQAAVSITNTCLIKDMEELFGSFVRVMATAIDEKSPVTGGHIKRVADLTMVMAEVINKKTDGLYADVFFNDDQLQELKMAAWMHDIGKVTTPVNIVEKAKKLESIVDRVDALAMKFRYHVKNIEIDALNKINQMIRAGAPEKEIQAVEKEKEQIISEVMEAMKFTISCNEPAEFMSEDRLLQLKEIRKMQYQKDGELIPIISDDEYLNLSIRKGSITEPERKKMQDHAAVTIKMLEQIPFTKKFKNIPSIAGAHHEFINGKGYPLGLKGDEIPLESRILAVLDITEALTAADRPYKKAMPLEQAHRILGFMAKDNELDPELVDLLIKDKVYELYLERAQERKNKEDSPNQTP